MVSCSKRYRVESQRWFRTGGPKIDVTECDTLDEVTEYVNMTKELYEHIRRPDDNCSCKYRSSSKKNRWQVADRRDPQYIYDDNHYWWGYAVFDYVTEKVIMEGGQGFWDEQHPMKSLKVRDIYFRRPGEIPTNYAWDYGEYEGWLQYRWGDGENAIEKVRARKAKQAERNVQKTTPVKKKPEPEFVPDYDDYDRMQDEWDDYADKELSKYRMEKYGW